MSNQVLESRNSAALFAGVPRPHRTPEPLDRLKRLPKARPLLVEERMGGVVGGGEVSIDRRQVEVWTRKQLGERSQEIVVAKTRDDGARCRSSGDTEDVGAGLRPPAGARARRWGSNTWA